VYSTYRMKAWILIRIELAACSHTNLGQWYLPPGFDGTGPAGSESADENETGSDIDLNDIDLNDADERSLRLAFAALKAQSNTSATLT
jgi:hypothetical protein